MPNPFFSFKQFTIHHDRCAMKVTTDGCLFGAWVAEQLKDKNLEQALDIGTGTGLLSLMVAQQNDVRLTAIELDAEAAAQARENVAASPWSSQIEVVQSDILQWQTVQRFPVIFSNPPFYEAEIVSEKEDRNKAHHAGGLRLADLLAKAAELATNDGSLYLLLPTKRKKEIYQLLHKTGWRLRQQVVVHPSITHAPFRLLLHADRQFAGEPSDSGLYIKTNDQQYSSAFTHLLKDYYLYL